MQKEVQCKMTFPELLEKTGRSVSPEQLDAILSDTSTIVSAGAGSGKTTVLSLRFVRLVLDGKAHSDEILTLTFTRKAAAEMYERIYRLLSLAAENDERIAEELRLHFPKARISTMDSFWGEIARTDSMRFGVTRDFLALDTDEGDAEDLVRAVYESLQGREELEEGFMILSALYKSEEILSFFLRIASEKTDILTSFDAKRNTEAYNALIALFQERYKGQRAAYVFSSLAALDKENPGNGQHEEIQKALDVYRTGDYSSLPAFNLNKLRKAADSDIRSFIKDEDCKGYFDTLRALDALEKTASDAEPVSRVVEAFIREIQMKKRAEGKLSYRDTETLCREILISNEDVRSYYKRRFRYIMVDEFQDNNSRQRDLLYLLSEKEGLHSPSVPPLSSIDPDKLFFVGDDKQSIYYFRGADVSVFRSLREDIKALGGNILSLSANYRSEPDLISCFNTVFASVFSRSMSREEEEKEKLLSSFTGERIASFYADSEPIQAREATDGVKPQMALYTIPADNTGEGLAPTEDSEAIFIARKILEIVNGDEYLVAAGSKSFRRPVFGDIAILLRTTAPQMPVERAFRLFGIPYTVQESTSAMLEGVGSDIYAFLQLLVYPEDRMSYMAILRSPFARISDEGLLFLEQDNAPAFDSDPSFSLESDRIAYAALKDLYAELRGLVGRRRISEILTRLFYESGYSTYLHSEPFLEPYAEHFSYIWAAAERFDANGKPLPLFLDYLRPLVGEAKKLRNASVQHLETDGVQIMTVHRSKGLQFPIVFLSDADHGSSGQAMRDKLIAFEGKNPLIIPSLVEKAVPDLILREKGEYTQRREEAELRRLLYVATTRAIDHLIITAHLRKRRTGTSLLDILREGWEEGEDEIEAAAEKDLYRYSDSEAGTLWYSQPVSSLPSYSHKRFGVKDASKAESSDFSSGEKLPSLPSDSVISAHGMQDVFGTMVHQRLEEAVSGKASALVFPQGLTEGEKNEILRALDEIAQGFAASDFYRDFISGHECSTEVRFYYPSDNSVLEGFVDLLVFGDEYNLVVDYKTDRVMNESVHMGQITAYASAMEDLYKKKCFSVLLYVRGWRRSTVVDRDGNAVRVI